MLTHAAMECKMQPTAWAVGLKCRVPLDCPTHCYLPLWPSRGLIGMDLQLLPEQGSKHCIALTLHQLRERTCWWPYPLVPLGAGSRYHRLLSSQIQQQKWSTMLSWKSDCPILFRIKERQTTITKYHPPFFIKTRVSKKEVYVIILKFTCLTKLPRFSLSTSGSSVSFASPSLFLPDIGQFSFYFSRSSFFFFKISA